jgi:oligopeptide transport system substrate-binding protein
MTERLRTLALLVGACISICGCSTGQLTSIPKLAKDQTLRVVIDDQPASLDPGQSQYAYETTVLRAITEPLLRPTADLAGTTPAAASSYDVNQSGTVYTFHLRKNAEYWDGKPVKAADFVYAWRRLIDPRQAAPTGVFFADAVLNGSIVFNYNPQLDAAKIDPGLQTLGLKALDDLTFQVTLSRPDPAIVWLAALPAGAPIREDVVTKYTDAKWATAPETLVTNGPFQVSSMVHKDHITVIANPAYWGGRPTLTSIVYRIIGDGAAALAAYRSGEVDAVDVQVTQAQAVAADSPINNELVKNPVLTVWWLAFGLTTAPFANNSKLRLAFAQAIDRDAFVRDVFLEQGVPANTFIPKGMRGYSPSLTSQHFDPTQARASLAGSGVTPAQLSGLKFTFDSTSAFGPATAKFVVAQLKANLGVDIISEGVDASTFQSRLEQSSFQFAGPVGWFADFPDGSDWYDIFRSSDINNFDRYSSTKYDQFVKAADGDNTPSRRDQEYGQAERLLVGDAPVAFLAQTVSWFLVRPYVRNLQTTPLDVWPGDGFPEKIYLSPH